MGRKDVGKHRLPPEEFKKLKRLVNSVMKPKTGLLARRNRINHAVWFHPFDPNEPPVTHGSIDMLLETLKPSSIEELQELSREIEELTLGLIKLHGDAVYSLLLAK